MTRWWTEFDQMYQIVSRLDEFQILAFLKVQDGGILWFRPLHWRHQLYMAAWSVSWCKIPLLHKLSVLIWVQELSFVLHDECFLLLCQATWKWRICLSSFAPKNQYWDRMCVKVDKKSSSRICHGEKEVFLWSKFRLLIKGSKSIRCWATLKSLLPRVKLEDDASVHVELCLGTNWLQVIPSSVQLIGRDYLYNWLCSPCWPGVGQQQITSGLHASTNACHVTQPSPPAKTTTLMDCRKM